MSSEALRGATAVRLGELLLAAGATVATAESCTGGLVAGAITDIAGSSGWFDRGFVTYSNAAKVAQLGVRPETLARHGAVSEAVAREMVAGALVQSDATWALAVTGIAGPGGATEGKPVGTVCFAWGRRAGSTDAETRHFPGDRAAVRRASVDHALQGLVDRLAARVGS